MVESWVWRSLRKSLGVSTVKQCCVHDMPDNMVDRADDHLFECIKRNGVLLVVYYKDSFDAGLNCLLDLEYIKEIDIETIIDIDKVWGWGKGSKKCMG